MNHIDLFSGIGGFKLAAQWAGFRTVVFCEKDEFCQKVLIKRFGAYVADPERVRELQSQGGIGTQRGRTGDGTPLIPDIRNLNGAAWRGATLLTGGFPCQPFSQAGKRRGTEDDRHLWPEMLRVITEARPYWVLGENVAGIINMELDTVLADLEDEGYEVGTVVIPATAVNAPHRRDRVWIIGHASGLGLPGVNGRGTRQELEDRFVEQKQGAPDSARFGLNGAGDARPAGGRESANISWEIPWIEVATEFCRVDDGVSDRVHRLKALGNAIVPQVAYEIIKEIAVIENHKKNFLKE